MALGLNDIREIVRDEIESPINRSDAAVITAVCRRLRPYAGINHEELVPFWVRHLVVEGQRAKRKAVVHVDATGERVSKPLWKLTLFEVRDNISRRKEGVRHDQLEVARWEAFEAEYAKRLAGRNPADHVAEEFFSEGEIKAIWASVAA